MKKYDALLGRILAKHRKAKRMTQLQVAKAMGKGRPTISNMERGDIGMGVDDFTAYCLAIGEDPIEILREIIGEAR